MKINKFKLAILALSTIAVSNPAKASVDVELGGFFEGYYGAVSQDAKGYRNRDFLRYSRLHIDLSKSFENGVKFGFHNQMQMEANTQPQKNRMSRSYFYLRADEGAVNLGAGDGVVYLLQLRQPGADSLVDGISPDFRFVQNPTNAPLRYKHGLTGTSDKIAYLTPKLNDFQLGASYSPTQSRKTLGSGLEGTDEKAYGKLRDIVELVARFDRSFDEIDFSASTGFTFAPQSKSFDASDLTAPQLDDRRAYDLSFKAGLQGWRLGFTYFQDDMGRQAYKDRVYYTGLDYSFAGYKYGMSWLSSNSKQGAIKETADRVSFGIQYTPYSGVRFNTSANIYRFDSISNPSDKKASSFLLGTKIDF